MGVAGGLPTGTKISWGFLPSENFILNRTSQAQHVPTVVLAIDARDVVHSRLSFRVGLFTYQVR